jgi:hypothetical protein
MIVHSSFRGFMFHIIVLTAIFGLTIANLIISSLGLWGGAKVAAIVLGCITLMILFAYAMYISSTYHYIKHPRDEPGNPDSHKPFFNLTGFGSKGYEPVPPTYNDEPEETA